MFFLTLVAYRTIAVRLELKYKLNHWNHKYQQKALVIGSQKAVTSLSVR